MSTREIEKHAKKVQIPFLVHFTRLANLASIIQHGLYPMSQIREIGVAPQTNDRFRLDGHLDGISLSIGFPNHRMFYALRQQSADVEWVVIIVSPEVLWQKESAFCCHNAADTRIRCQTLSQLKTKESFVGMFKELKCCPSREEQRLKIFDPTDDQAEVLLFDIIEPDLISGVVFRSATAQKEYRALLGGRRNFIHTEGCGMFASRRYKRLYGS